MLAPGVVMETVSSNCVLLPDPYTLVSANSGMGVVSTRYPHEAVRHAFLVTHQIILIIIIMFSFMCYLTKLEHTARHPSQFYSGT